MAAFDRVAPVHAGGSTGSPQASIIIVNYNKRRHLSACLPSLYRSAGDFEVILSDNGSTDGSLEFVSSAYPAVCIVANGSNIGFGAASNRAGKQARNDILVFLNPDTTMEPDWLVHLLEPFGECGVGLATSKILLMQDPSRINVCGNRIHLTGLTLCHGMGQSRCQFTRVQPVGAVSGAAFAIRRELFEQLGGFDEEFFLYMEEIDLSWRAWLAGWRCVLAPGSVVYHDYALRFGPRKVFYQERNRYLMLLKSLKWPTLIVLTPALLLTELVTWGFVLWKDRANLKNKLLACTWVIRNWPLIMQKRAATQAFRVARDRDMLRHTGSEIDFGQVATGSVARLAQLIFDPLFGLLRAAALALVRW